jgi:hypothetical protein
MSIPVSVPINFGGGRLRCETFIDDDGHKDMTIPNMSRSFQWGLGHMQLLYFLRVLLRSIKKNN